MAEKLKIGLFGFGCVGQGLYHVLNNSTGFKASLECIVVKDKTKKRPIASELISYNKWDVLDNGDISVVVELIDDAEEAFEIVSEAMRRGKHVVTANKKMLALHLNELYALQNKFKVSLLYEAAACGSIPIIRTLEEYFDNEDLKRVTGIFNGTTNFILTQTINERISYPDALLLSQEKGFAESDPTNDVEGYDPKYKAVILALHAFGKIIEEDKVLNLGITTLQEEDIQYASEKGYKIKLMPVIERLDDDKFSVFVAPRFVSKNSQLYNVDSEFNGVIVEGKFSGEQFLQGRGAGSLPTGAAVLSDVSALSYGYRYEFKKYAQSQHVEFTNEVMVEIYLRYNNPADLEMFDFKEINQKYTEEKYSYVVGTINLNELRTKRKYILDNKLFISLVSNKLTLIVKTPVVEKGVVEEKSKILIQ